MLQMSKRISADNFIGGGISGMCFRCSETDKIINISLTDEDEGDRCKVEVEI